MFRSLFGALSRSKKGLDDAFRIASVFFSPVLFSLVLFSLVPCSAQGYSKNLNALGCGRDLKTPVLTISSREIKN